MSTEDYIKKQIWECVRHRNALFHKEVRQGIYLHPNTGEEVTVDQIADEFEDHLNTRIKRITKKCGNSI